MVAFYDETLKEDLTPGLFSDDYYWWESGLAFNTLIEYYGLTNDSQFNARISQALQHQLGDSDAFMPANQTRSFNDGFNYKNSASNGQFFLLAARLADLTGNATYAEWANKVYSWTTDVGLVTDDHHVFDGTDDSKNCSEVNQIQWTSNHAEFTEGAALMYKVVCLHEHLLKRNILTHPVERRPKLD